MGLFTRLLLSVKKLTAFKSSGVAEPGNTARFVFYFLCVARLVANSKPSDEVGIKISYRTQ